MGIRAAGEVCTGRPKSPGSVIEQDRSIAVVELAKSIVPVKSPMLGTVLERNGRLAEAPDSSIARPTTRAGWRACAWRTSMPTAPPSSREPTWRQRWRAMPACIGSGMAHSRSPLGRRRIGV
ncbi:MAG: hypothetical protein KGL18_17045 [Burkholderiales bacterium]|nr:hypothetical protein [Burkholderiales bacterium]MDE1927078.1 hypothetical protein [Burkholderiales bacterium]MDE2160140.1 hypothetical protein [Burkholderiales bacterium]MDE2504674.1 hypothetical protein [Burkholderiales bacterium]